jgi:hypothetical protein
MSPAALDVGRRSELDAAYQEGSQYLQSIGIESKGEIARILDIAMNPNSLFLTLRDKKRAVNAHVRTHPNVAMLHQLMLLSSIYTLACPRSALS